MGNEKSIAAGFSVAFGNRPSSRAWFSGVRLVLCLLILATSPHLFSQAGRGAVSGLVTDASGAIIPGATVTATDTATGTKLTAVSTAAGIYSFVSLSPGKYEVSVSQSGFETTVRKGVIVTVDQTTTANLSMKVGSVNEVVTVNETSSLVDTTNSTVGQLISSETIDRVPLLTRNVFDLVQLSAGVTPANGAPNSSSSFAIENISSGRPGVDVSSYTINGAIVGSVYYMVDGSPLGIAENNAAAIIPAMELPEDAVEETRVETQNTPASYQSGGAGVISLATKAGTNVFHGDAFGVWRPDVLAANEYFNKQSELSQGQANTSPAFHRYQYGGAIGGPIIKNKLFFFGDYEYTDEQRYDGSNSFTVPTTAERNGDFSGDTGFTIYNPLVPDDSHGNRQEFPTHNVIPAADISPTGQMFLQKMPTCNIGASCDSSSDDVTANFFKPGLDPTFVHRFDIRMDWAQSDKQRFFGRFSFDRMFFSLYNAFGNMFDLNYAQNTTNGRNILLGDDITVSSSTVLQLRYSFTRHYENQGGDPRQNGFDITTLGFPSSLASEEVIKLLPFVVFDDAGGGVGGTADYNTFRYASENSDATASITKLFGKHEVSAGFEYMKRFLNVGQPPAASGAYAFDISATDQTVASASGGSDFASLLLGQGEAPGNETNDYPNFTKDLFAAETNPYYAMFIEDTYHPTKTLTLTGGLRWDIFGGKTERHNRMEYFNPSVSNTVDGVSYTGAEIYAGHGSKSPFTTNLTDFGPRLGFSLQPEHRIVIRGGAGFYYGPSAHMVAGTGLDSDGFSADTTWDATCYNGADQNTVINGSSLCAGAAAGSPAPSPTGPFSLSNPFPNGVIPQFASAPAGLANNLGQNLNTMLRSQRTTVTYDFNFGVEYELPHQVVFSAGYVGSRGLFLPLGSADLNVLDLATIGKYGASLCVTSDPSCSTDPNQWAAIQPSTNSFYGASTVPPWLSLQQFPQYGNGNYGSGSGVVVHGYPGGDSDYSSLQMKLQKRLTSHFTSLASFTWAKLMTDDGNPPLGFVGSHNGGAQDWRNLSLEHSISPQDVKYQFTGQASYDLPVGRGRAVSLNGVGDAIAGGWTANLIAYLSTGVPIASPVTGTSPSYFNQRANMTCDASHGAPHSQTLWFKPDCFAFPASPFVAGTAPAYLDHVRTMGAQDFDLSVYKHFTFGKERDIRFEASCYNLGNHAQLGMPSVPSLTVPNTFGLILSTVNSPRQFQFATRFTF